MLALILMQTTPTETLGALAETLDSTSDHFNSFIGKLGSFINPTSTAPATLNPAGASPPARPGTGDTNASDGTLFRRYDESKKRKAEANQDDDPFLQQMAAAALEKDKVKLKKRMNQENDQNRG
jgi:hypothetical protein